MTIREAVYEAEHKLLYSLDLYTENGNEAKRTLEYIDGVLDTTNAVVKVIDEEIRKTHDEEPIPLKTAM